MSDTFYSANSRWIVESHAPMFSDYETLLNTNQPNLVEPGRSTTVHGYQIPHTIEETQDLAEFIIKKTNNILTKSNTPCQIHNHIQTWSITYYPGGWKGIHNHQKGNTGATAVLYFDDVDKRPNNEGALYAVLQDEAGDTYVEWWQPSAGKLLVMDARIWHGVYPTVDERRVMVLDFEAAWNE